MEAEIETNVGNGRLFAYLAEHGEINGTEYRDNSRVVLNCRIPRMYLRGVNGDDTTVSVRDSQVSDRDDHAVSVSQEDETSLSGPDFSPRKHGDTEKNSL